MLTFLRPTCRALCIALALLGTGAAFAGEAGTAGVSIELSATEELEGACRMSFLIRNAYPVDIDSAVYEAVLFSQAGQVVRMSLLDFRDLPAGRPRVRQFEFDELSCAGIGRVLINGAHACSGEGLEPGACIEGMDLKSLVDVEVIG